MKLFKKLTALIIALVLALAMFALAACGDKNETEQPDDNQQGEEGNGNGNGDNDGDGNGDDSGDDGEVTIATIIAALEKAEISNVSITGTVNGSRTYKKSTDKTNWTDLPDKQLTLGASFDIKVDAKGDMDMHSTHSTERKAPDQDNPNTYFSGYSFIRSGEQFYKNEESKTKMPDAITNWDNQTLNYQSSSDLPDDQMWAKMLNIGLGNLDKISYINRVNSVLIQLADATKSLTLEDGKATIDLFKLAHTVLSEIDKDFQTIKASTTVEQVLELNSIKTYLPIIVNAVTIEEAVNLAKGFAPEGEPWSTLIGVIDGDNKVAPDENSTLWDYLVKLLKSDELKDAANKILTDEGLSDMEGVGTLSKPVAEISCDYIMNLIGHILSNGGSSSGPGGPSESNPGPNVDAGGPQEDSYPAATEAEVGNNEENPEEDIFSDYKKIVSYYAGLVSETKIEMKNGEGDDPDKMTISDAKLEYTLDGSDITGMKFDAKYSKSTTDGAESSSGGGTTYQRETTSVAPSFNLSFAATTLADISKAKVPNTLYEGNLTKDAQFPGATPDNTNTGIAGVKSAKYSLDSSDFTSHSGSIDIAMELDNGAESVQVEFYSRTPLPAVEGTGTTYYHYQTVFYVENLDKALGITVMIAETQTKTTYYIVVSDDTDSLGRTYLAANFDLTESYTTVGEILESAAAQA